VIPVAILTFAAESALGSGSRAVAVAPIGEPARSAIERDPECAAAGLGHPWVARAHVELGPEDRATALLERACRAIAVDLDARLPDWRARRVGLALGTSSGGMQSLTGALARLERGEVVGADRARATPYFGPLARVPEILGVAPVERTQVLAACASSGMAIGLGCRWLEHGLADLVIAGGYDAVALLVAAGFECLGATSATRPAPFRRDRDGMALGEGVALLALGRAGAGTSPLGYVRGFGAASDAVHITAPDREGRGLARAAQAALEDAGLGAEDVDLVSAHGTATAFNDAAEARALEAVLGPRAAEVPVHPYKAVIGHTLGAGSALELLAALGACAAGILPAAAGTGEIDPEARVRLLEHSEPGAPERVLALSAAFGGASSALVGALEAGMGRPRPGRPVAVVARGEPVTGLDRDALPDLCRIDRVRLSRLDAASALAVAAAGSAVAALSAPLPDRTAVIVGTATASVENDELFHRRLRARGASAAEPRRFPPTSPNLAAGQCSIAFGLRGPSLAVGWDQGAPLEALLVGQDLVASGDADAAVVLAVEHVDAVVPRLWAAVGWPCPEHAAAAVVLGVARPGEPSLDRLEIRRRRETLARSGSTRPAVVLLEAAGAALR
jgi:3-oxoacyl-[acyl-carrier-protein] synthase II